MKTLFSSLLLGAVLSLLSPATSAQRVYGSSHTGYGRREYVANRVWIPGGYQTVCRRVWVPGCVERVWVEPSFGFRLGSCGERVRVQISAGYWKNVHSAGHYETRRVRVWVPGYWASRGHRG